MHDLTWLTERPIAHRGYHDMNRTRMENSPSAFEAAIEAGFAIECDVHPLADGSVVAFHDDDLRRLTGREGRIRELGTSDLSSLRLGGTDDRPLTLVETLSLVAGRVPLVVELKGFLPGQEDFAERVVATLRDYGGPVAAMSFDQSLVRGLRDGAPDLALGLTAEGQDEHQLERHDQVSDIIDFVSYGVNDLPNEFVASVRDAGKPVITWTVRTPEERALTRAHADQMTFEGFDPREG